MRRWSVGARGLEPVEVTAASWISALGLALEGLGKIDGIDRLACEVLPNGTVIVREASGAGYIVQAADGIAYEAADPATEDIIVATGDVVTDRLGPIAEADDEAAACRAALSAATEIVPAFAGSVLLRSGDHLRFVAAIGPAAKVLPDVVLAPGAGIAGYSMKRQRIVVLASAKDDARHFGDVDRQTGFESKALCCIPVIHAGASLGALELVNLPEGRRFARADVQHLRAIAAALGERIAALAE